MFINKIKFIWSILLIMILFTSMGQNLVYASDINDLSISASFSSVKEERGYDGEVLSISLGGLEDSENGGNRILAEYRNAIIGVSGVATLTFIVLFIINFLKLGKSGDNPQERTNSIMAIIFTGIGAAGAGGVLLFITFFYNLFL